LEGQTNLYRIRFYREQYRIVYRVSEHQRRVIVERVRPRGTAYRGL
jgi:mRNA-degrading endonuclease RelE of RelBE toxin-antitoxin system